MYKEKSKKWVKEEIKTKEYSLRICTMIIVGMMVSSYKVELREKSLVKKKLQLRKK
jgi:hypothetical protein